MRRYLLKRLLELLPTTAGVLLLTFVLFYVVGGSPAEVALGQHANAASLAAFDARYGYDKPLLCGHWAPSRAIDPSAPLPVEGALVPAFPLAEGTWRIDLPGRSPRLVAGHVLSDGGATSTNLLVRAAASSRFAVPAGAVCTAILLAEATPPPADGAAGAKPADKPSGARLFRRTRHFFDSQLFGYLSSLACGDLGESTAYGMRVADVLKAGVGPSLTITVPILFGGTILALMLAMVAAAWRGRGPDRAVLFGSTLLMSVNYVVWILAGQFLLAYKLRLFPIWGFEGAAYLLLPVLIGIFSGLGRDIRFFRTAILDELGRPYVRTAMAKGLSRRRVLWGHVFRNSLIPVVTYVSLSIPYLFTGSLLLESFFGIPGLGGVSLNAINSADVATVRAIVILGSLLYQAVNLLTDLAYAWLDPRVRLT